MSQKDDAGTERGQVPPSAVHRQRDDHLGPEEAPYDAESGLQRLRGWMGEEEPPGAGPDALTRVLGGTLPASDRRNAGDTT